MQNTCLISRGDQVIFCIHCSELSPSYKIQSLFARGMLKLFFTPKGRMITDRVRQPLRQGLGALPDSRQEQLSASSVCPATHMTMTFLSSWLSDGCRAVSKCQNTSSETKSHEYSGYLLGKRLIPYCRLQKIVVKLGKNNS